MSATTKIENRVVIPAWNQSHEAARSPEIQSLSVNKFSDKAHSSLTDVYTDFLHAPELGKAIDLLNVAYIQGDVEKASLAADYVLRTGKRLPPALSGLARLVIDNIGLKKSLNPSMKAAHQIRSNRMWLKSHPSDSLSWIDLSRLYMSIGEVNAAERAIRIGLKLANSNRWATRVASRFYYNLDEFDKAHALLLKHPDIKTDPWLLSAELAVTSGAGRPSRHWNSAKRALEFGFDGRHVSELQSSIGSMELMSGALKKAKKLFKESLDWPNANVLAQAKWAEKKGCIGLVNANTLEKQKKAYEAKYLDAYARQEMKLALEYARKWIEEEPFSAKPAIQASYIASLLDRYEEAAEISTNGLKINPHDETLQLNQIFSRVALAEINNTTGDHVFVRTALHRIESMLKSDNKTIVGHALANLGLIRYRQQKIENGKVFYENAIAILKSLNHPSAVLAELNHLRESLIADAPWKEDLFTKLESLAGTGGFWDEPSVSFYLRKLGKIRISSSDWRVLLTESTPDENFVIETEENTDSLEGYHFDFDPKKPTIWLPKNGNK
ncbi:tetratricopeptide repeat protein [Pantoea ananatis]|uniref:tetratricopeptide repeat protein n=1 Tax=Pantoea ananas TaxID=553 RepID=UPI003FA4CE78